MSAGFRSGRGGLRPGAGRKPTWKDPQTETTTIRVPRYLSKQLLEIAKELDVEGFLNNSTNSENQELLSEIKDIVSSWSMRSNPTSTRWEKANLLLGELQKLLGIAPKTISREEIGRSEFFGQVRYEPLKESQLAFRLNVPDSTLGNKRANESLADWTRSKDPNGIAWEYRQQFKLYFPIEIE